MKVLVIYHVGFVGITECEYANSSSSLRDTIRLTVWMNKFFSVKGRKLGDPFPKPPENFQVKYYEYEDLKELDETTNLNNIKEPAIIISILVDMNNKNLNPRQIAETTKFLVEQKNKCQRQINNFIKTKKKPSVSLNEHQINIIRAIKAGLSGKQEVDDREILESLNQSISNKLNIDRVRYYLEELEKEKYVTYHKVPGYTGGIDKSYICSLTNKGKVAAEDPNYLIPEKQTTTYDQRNSTIIKAGDITGAVIAGGNASGVAGQNLTGVAGGDIHHHAPEQQQTLAEAAGEIQKLLKQLEQTNPTATEAEKVAYLDDETTPSFKRRVVGALQAGGEAAFDQFILENKYLKVAKAAIKGWFKQEHPISANIVRRSLFSRLRSLFSRLRSLFSRLR